MLSATLRTYFASDVFALTRAAKRQGEERKHAAFSKTKATKTFM
jgi:hypothetical protein